MNLRGKEVGSLPFSLMTLFSWSQEFLRLGGYAALLTRLNEILEVEWRFVVQFICGSECTLNTRTQQGRAAR